RAVSLRDGSARVRYFTQRWLQRPTAQVPLAEESIHHQAEEMAAVPQYHDRQARSLRTLGLSKLQDLGRLDQSNRMLIEREVLFALQPFEPLDRHDDNALDAGERKRIGLAADLGQESTNDGHRDGQPKREGGLAAWDRGDANAASQACDHVLHDIETNPTPGYLRARWPVRASG